MDDIKSIIEELEENLIEIQRQVATNFLTFVAIETPKKTGEATGEWQVNIGKKATTKTGRKDLNGANTVLIGKRIIDKKRFGLFTDIWISNLADHIIPLNNGSSAQAPKKFIERALKKANGR